ncbi:BTAD domain-containing putative transcriptional regulator [Streptomyces sp. NPDC058001]|uniref:AfsR/SARP family transcriptional regulator n=1 Tax=Streptomyces sp. NPDC058001 TaxID=3346300 RepID=UPI0036EF65DF
MRIFVLGSLDAELRGVPILPTAAKPRQILTLLAIYANQVLPVSALMEEIWGDAPPRSALTTLQTYILQLRRCMENALDGEPGGSKELLLTRHGGYLLHAEPGSIDVHEYDRLSSLGQRAFDRGDHQQAAELFREALGLWRGPALVDVRTGPLLEIEAMRLEESRLGMLERRNDVELRLGRHAELLTELTALTARHPLHEALHAQSMVAFYRAGRPSAALDVFQNLRTHLVEELGIEPSQRLQRLQRAVLGSDPALDVDAGTGRVLDRFTG